MKQRYLLMADEGAPAGGAAPEAGTPPEGNTATPAEASPYAGWANSFPKDVREKHSNLLKEYAGKSLDDFATDLSAYKAREDRTIIVPADNATEEEIGEFYHKMGIPDSPDQYGAVEGVPKEASDALAKEFHELALTETQGKKIIGMFGALASGAQATHEEAAKEAAAKLPEKLLQAVGGDETKRDETINLSKALLSRVAIKQGERGAAALQALDSSGVLADENVVLFLAQASQDSQGPQFVAGEDGAHGDMPKRGKMSVYSKEFKEAYSQ